MGSYEFKVGGIVVKFPYEKPYPAQISLMANTVLTLKNKQNAILESPTGTGKSLALLSAALAYQEELKKNKNITEQPDKLMIPTEKEYLGFFPPMLLQKPGTFIFNPLLVDGDESKNIMYEMNPLAKVDSANIDAQNYTMNRSSRGIPQIWYSTRTHQQLKQLIVETKKLVYHPQICILASRSHLCVFDRALNSNDVDSYCYSAVEKGTCPYNARKYIPKEFKPNGIYEKFQIEELVVFCKNDGICPYNVTKLMMKKADIVFCPYNYFLDPKIKGQMQLDLTGVFLIIDEAHNIDSVCRENGSFHQPLANFQFAIMMIKERLPKAPLEVIKMALSIVLEFLQNIEKWLINQINLLRESDDDFFVASDNYKTFQNDWNVSFESWPKLLAAFDCLFKLDNGINTPKNLQNIIYNKLPMRIMGTLEQIWVMLSLCFKLNMKNINDYKLVVTQDEVLHGLVMNPAIVFDWPAREASSVILTSGTMTPLDTMEYELGKEFHSKISTPHVIDSSQIAGYVISKAPDNTRISSVYSYINSNRENLSKALGDIFLNLLPCIPDGVLFFVPSYAFLNPLIEYWKLFGYYDKINEIKTIFVDKTNEDVFTSYRKSIDDGKGGMLVGVFRGRSSEGIDFRDEQARAVFAFGIPYPSMFEPEILLKNNYNELKKKGSGRHWFDTQAFRSLFQATGRVIRHINDYGTVILLDERYSKEKERFPKWIKHMIVDSNVQDAATRLKTFFNEMYVRYPSSDPLKLGRPLKLVCSSCKRLSLFIKAIDNQITVKCNRKGIKSLVEASDDDEFYVLKRSSRYDYHYDLGAEILSHVDKNVYRVLRCECGVKLGVYIVATCSDFISHLGSTWMIISRLNILHSRGESEFQKSSKKKATIGFDPGGGPQKKIVFK